MAATLSASLLPSSQPLAPSVPPSLSPSSSSLCAGGIHLRSSRSFSPCLPLRSPQLASKVCARRFGTAIRASADYYATLGVPKSASGKEIKAAYRKLARQVKSLHIFFSWFCFGAVDCRVSSSKDRAMNGVSFVNFGRRREE